MEEPYSRQLQVQAMGDSGLDLGESNRRYEKWLDIFVIFWRVEVTEFPDGLDVGCEIKQAKMFPSSSFWTLERLVFSSKKEVMAG